MIQGRLDISSSRHLAQIAAIFSGLEGDVEFDLSGATSIDSSGWAALAEAVEALNRAGVSARVAGVSDTGSRVADAVHYTLPTCLA